MNDLSFLKKKEELEDFLKNLGIEYRFGCYERKNPEACLLLGEYMEVFEKQQVQANKVFKKTCNFYQMGKGCHSYGNSCFFGRSMERNYNLALDYYIRGCLFGFGYSCYNAGKLLSADHKKIREEIPINDEKAKIMFEKGCFFENPESCSEASKIGNIEKNYKYMTEYAEKGCKLNDYFSCRLLEHAYVNGKGIQKNLEKANELNEKCKLLRDQNKRINPYTKIHKF